jgi:hypothetical protein
LTLCPVDGLSSDHVDGDTGSVPEAASPLLRGVLVPLPPLLGAAKVALELSR